MTAEIAILNKAAVALAADSAVTIGRQQKIFNTVNKVFMLSKRHPVGVMIFGNAQLLGAPWETIVKLYRAKLRAKSFAHLEDYCSDFLDFLAGNKALFPAGDQDNYFQRLVSAFYRRINNDIQSAVRKHIEKTGKVPVAAIGRIVHSQIQAHFEDLQRCARLRGFTQQFEKNLLKKYSSELTKLRKQAFQKLPISSADMSKIRVMSGWLFTKDNFRLRGTSGVVIAGFGDRDVYPRLCEFLVEGIIRDKLKYIRRRSTQVGGVDCISNIIPFGQIDVVRGFFDGMDPGMEMLLNKFLDEVFANYPGVLLDHVKGLAAHTKAIALKKTKAVSQAILRKFRKEFETFRRDSLVNPIVSTVAVLPKDELAAMAEALVNLTSFKRRFSPDAETVGGPIDVAVLSKGDGFIWVKRKQYFNRELNRHFWTNYFEDV